MKKNIKLVIVAVIVLVALSAVYLIADKSLTKPSKDDSPNEPSVMDNLLAETKPLWDYKTEDIDRVEYNLNDYSYTIKTGNPYTIEGYNSSLMSSINLQTAVGFVASLPVLRTIDFSEDKLPQYGIDSSSQTVTIYFADGRIQTLKLGYQTGVEKEAYAYDVQNGVLCVITKDCSNRLTAHPGKYRNHKICTLNNYFIREMEVSNAGGRVMGITQGDIDGTYVMTYPYKGAGVSYAKVQEILNTFEDVTADEIVEEFATDTSKYGFDNATKVYIFDSGQKHNFKFGSTAEDGGMYIMYGDRPVVYRGTCALYEIIKNIDPVAYLEPYIHLVNLEDVYKLDIKKGKKTITMKRNSKNKDSYTINGKSVSAESFKKKYQAVIGLDYSDVAESVGALKEYCALSFTLSDNTTKEYVYYKYDDNYCVVKADNGLNCLVLTNNIDNMLSDVED